MDLKYNQDIVNTLDSFRCHLSGSMDATGEPQQVDGIMDIF